MSRKILFIAACMKKVAATKSPLFPRYARRCRNGLCTSALHPCNTYTLQINILILISTLSSLFEHLVWCKADFSAS